MFWGLKYHFQNKQAETDAFCLLQQYILVKFTKSEQLFKVTAMEVKILIFLGYYIGLYIFYTAIFIVATKYIVGYLEDFIGYLICKQFTTSCDDKVLHRPIMNAFTVLMLLMNISPAIHLIYVTNFHEMSTKFRKWRLKYTTGQTESSKQDCVKLMHIIVLCVHTN